MRFSSALLVPLISLLAGPCETPKTDTLEPAETDTGGFVSVSVDDDVGCALRDDGSLHCWGGSPTAVSPLGRFTAVSVGGSALFHGSQVACGIRESGEIECWGRDHEGLLVPPGGTFSAVSVGKESACGVRKGGELVCWGDKAERWSLPEDMFVSVSVGNESACGVRADGAAVCWGRNFSGRVIDVGPFVSVDVGESHGCGLRADGEVECWPPWRVGGFVPINHGQWSPPAGEFLDVAVNSLFSCGLRADGEVVCWGARRPGTCADFITKCPGWGGDPIPEGPFAAFDVASGFEGADASVCAVRVGGEILCWGERDRLWRPPVDAFAAIDVDGAVCGLRPDGQVVCWGARVRWLDDIPAGAFIAVSGADLHACGLRPDDTAECWGDNTWGAATAPQGRFLAVDAGWRLSCGLRPDGAAECWGDARSGVTDPPPGPFTAIEAESEYACGLRPDGAAECWGGVPGSVRSDPAADFAETDFADPVWRGTYPGGTFSAVSASGLVACGIRPEGVVQCWSPYWPPGLGVSDPDAPTGGSAPPVSEPPRRGVPEKLAWVDGDLPGGPYVALASGWWHTCGIRPDAAVECHGPRPRSPDGRFTTVHVGDSAGCGIRPSGELACWRLSAVPVDWDPQFALAPTERVIATDSTWDGQCALVDTGDIVCTVGMWVRLPDRVEGPYEQISVGGGAVDEWGSGAADGPLEARAHVCAVDPRGRLDCWGDNDRGQTALPAPWLADPPYRAVAAGFAHSCAIGASGAVICWGDDRHDQTRSPPGEFTALGAGQWHTCALRADGEIICWGDGPAAVDQEYDDPPPQHPSEPPPGPYTSLAVGQWHTCGLRPDGTATCWLSY